MEQNENESDSAAAENTCPNGALLCLFGNEIMCGCFKTVGQSVTDDPTPNSGTPVTE